MACRSGALTTMEVFDRSENRRGAPQPSGGLRRRIAVAVLAVTCWLAAPATNRAAMLDVRKVSELAGVPATITADGVVRITWPRTDVVVRVDGAAVKPFAGLTTWAAFAPSASGATAAGEVVVFEDEVDAAVDAALAGGLQVTALHNCFLHDEPRVYSLHIGGEGAADKLVAGVRDLWEAIKAVRRAHPQPSAPSEGKAPAPGRIDARAIERIVERRTETQDGVVKVTFSRDGLLRMTKITATMGLATWAAFSGSDRTAVMDGEIILTADEVSPVLRALRAAGIHIVALHNHMIGEQPTYYFAHFRGRGEAERLAKAFVAALTAQRNASKPGNVRP